MKLLSLDGGGIRGLILCQLLVGLEDALGRPISGVFDWIAGSSTGGMLALNLGLSMVSFFAERLIILFVLIRQVVALVSARVFAVPPEGFRGLPALRLEDAGGGLEELVRTGHADERYERVQVRYYRGEKSRQMM